MNSPDDNMPTQAEMASLSDAVAVHTQLNNALVDAVRNAERLKRDILNIEIQVIPSLMAQAGNIDSFSLEDGRSVTLKNEVYASITKAHERAAFDWLTNHGHADLIKDTIAIDMGRDASDRQREEILAAIAAHHFTFKEKESVHPQTLGAFVREQIERGNEIPREVFGVFEQRRAVIK